MKSCRFFLVALCVLGCPAFAKENPDKLLGSGTITGKLLGFRWGDYLHAEFRSEAGKQQSLFVGDVEACFMALHASERLTVRYNKISRYFEQGGGYFPADDIVQIQADTADFQTWKKNFDPKRDFDACETQIEQHTLPGESE